MSSSWGQFKLVICSSARTIDSNVLQLNWDKQLKWIYFCHPFYPHFCAQMAQGFQVFFCHSKCPSIKFPGPESLDKIVFTLKIDDEILGGSQLKGKVTRFQVVNWKGRLAKLFDENQFAGPKNNWLLMKRLEETNNWQSVERWAKGVTFPPESNCCDHFSIHFERGQRQIKGQFFTLKFQKKTRIKFGPLWGSTFS